MSDLKITKSSSVVPDNREEAIRWYLARGERWEVDAADLGLTPARVAELRAALAAADAAEATYARLQAEAAAAGTLARSTASEMNKLGNATHPERSAPPPTHSRRPRPTSTPPR